MKYEKFEGSLGEFLEEYSKGCEFYTLDSGFGYLIETPNIDSLRGIYLDGVYVEKEEVWTDHLPVLCWVKNSPDMIEESVALVVKHYSLGYVTDLDDDFLYARPVTQEEIDKMIWKK